MKRDCFYEAKVTTKNKTETYHFGYMPYKMIMKDVKQFYKDGADAVELKQITKKYFDKLMEPYTL